jgi:flagellar basal-body rod protein FlgB
MTATHSGHITTTPGTTTLGELKYRIPFQPSLDGNTVEAPVEQSKFIENSMRYQASLDFINRRVADMNLAIAGQ